MLTELLEHVAAGGRVDREAGIIYGAKILGRVSVNGRSYSDAALNDAVRLYEGCKVCLDHDRNNPRRERGILEEVAVIKNARRDGDSVRGDLHLFKTHPAYAVIMDRAANHAATLGLSHNAEGQQSRDGRIVESLSKVRTVDLVGNPATANSLFESSGLGASGIPTDASGFAAWGRGGAGVLVESTSPSASDDEDRPSGTGFSSAVIKSIRGRCLTAIAEVVNSDQPLNAKMQSIREILVTLDSALAELDTAGAAISDATDGATKTDEQPTMESREDRTERFVRSGRY